MSDIDANVTERTIFRASQEGFVVKSDFIEISDRLVKVMTEDGLCKTVANIFGVRMTPKIAKTGIYDIIFKLNSGDEMVAVKNDQRPPNYDVTGLNLSL